MAVISLVGHAELRQRETGVCRVSAERVQRLQPFAFVMRAAGGFAVNGDEVVPPRPHAAIAKAPIVEQPAGLDTLARSCISHSDQVLSRYPVLKIHHTGRPRSC
jgi:hypothetical protein